MGEDLENISEAIWAMKHELEKTNDALMKIAEKIGLMHVKIEHKIMRDAVEELVKDE